jgi:succinate dehydrogenase / fumarate reductase iron-sulfur subunit
MDAAACIGCGACVATCKNASAALFTSAKINHLNTLYLKENLKLTERVKEMTAQMAKEGFGHCTFTGACEVECPEGISIVNIAEMNSAWMKQKLFG